MSGKQDDNTVSGTGPAGGGEGAPGDPSSSGPSPTAPTSPLRALSPSKVAAAIGASTRAVQLWCTDREKFPEACPHTVNGKRLLLNLEEVKAWMEPRGLDARNRPTAAAGAAGETNPETKEGDDGLFGPSLLIKSSEEVVKDLQFQLQRALASLGKANITPAQHKNITESLQKLDQTLRMQEDRLLREEERRRTHVPRERAVRLVVRVGKVVREQVENITIKAPQEIRAACLAEGVANLEGPENAEVFQRVAVPALMGVVQRALSEIADGVEAVVQALEAAAPQSSVGEAA